MTEDRADTVVFGCTGMTGVARAVSELLGQRGLNVPVIDPMQAALKFAELLVDLHLAQSQKAFPRSDSRKPMTGYPGILVDPSR